MFCVLIVCVNVVFVHSRDAKKTKCYVMSFETKIGTNLGMKDCKKDTIEEEKSGHCGFVMPMWRVEDVDV